jgi:Ca-activated chloride channel family protein
MPVSRRVLAVASAVLVAAAVRAQQPGYQEPTFRAGTRTVPVYASVTDEIGRFVLDLQRDDFEVRDDGKPQKLTLFTKDEQPLTAIVLLDGSRSMVNALETVMTAADHFVVRLRPGDRARVGSFADEIRFTPSFSTNRDELARQVNDLFDLRIGASTRLWDAVAQAATSFEGSQGRRIVVVFSDGEDTASNATYDETLGKARRGDVMVYAVIIRGVERPSEDRRFSRRSRPQDLADMALATGGGYYAVGNVLDDMNAIATQIGEELHSQYVLGFMPQELDGKLHKLDVRVKRPHVKIHARESYVAEPETGADR